MRNFIFCLIFVLFLLTSCVDVEKKYADYKINNEAQHYGAKRFELKKDVFVYSYDGVKEYSDFGLKGQYENEEELTFMVWISPSGKQTNPIIDNSTLLLWITEKENILFSYKYKKDKSSKIDTVMLTSSSKYKKNEWQLITVTYKKNQFMNIYINDKLDSSREHTNGYGQYFLSDSYKIAIKKNHADKNWFYKGLISTDEIKIYNKALKLSDIRNYYKKNKDKYIY